MHVNFYKEEKKINYYQINSKKSYENENSYICKEKSEDKYLKDKKCCKVRDHCFYAGKYRSVAHSTCNLKYNICKEINDADYKHAKRVCKDFKINLVEYHELYVQSDTLLLVDLFNSFRNMCLKK